MRKYAGCLVLVLAVFLMVHPVAAKTAIKQANDNNYTEIKKEIESLKEGQAGLGRDLQDIKKLLQALPRQQAAPAPPPPPPAFTEAIIDIKGAPIKGSKDAKLVLVEFTDYECPFCGRFARDTQPQITKEYIATGKMRQVFMDFPLTVIHKMAQKAAEAGQCAQDQGKFWEMSDKLFENPNNNTGAWLAPENILKIAEGIGLDAAAFKTCLDSGKHAEDVKKRAAEAGKAGRTGAPAFYLGYIMPDGMLKATKQIKGAAPFGTFKAAIDEMLASQK